MDVILRNDPSLMNFQSYNEFTSDDVYDSEIFVEGAIGDKLKNLFKRIIEFIKRIVENLRQRFAANRIKKYKKLINDPKKAEELKQRNVAKWDSELNIHMYECTRDIFVVSLKFFEQLVNSLSQCDINKCINTIENKRNMLKTLVEKSKSQQAANEKWTEYDALVAVVNESEMVEQLTYAAANWQTFVNTHNAGTLDSFYEKRGCSKEKIEEMLKLIATALPLLSEGGVQSNKYYGADAMRSGAYTGYKKYDAEFKKTGKATSQMPTQEFYTNDMMSLDELDAYIEYAMNDLHDAMELRNRLIQESDDDTVEDFEESDTTDETPDDVDDVEECGDGCKPTTEYYSDAIVRNYNEPVQENKTYCLKTNDMFTTESYDEPSGPNRFYQETDPSLEAAAKAAKGVIRWAGIGINTGVTIALSAQAFAAIKVIDSIATSLTYNKKLGRFPSDIKRTMDILKNSKDGTSDTSQLAKALKDVKSETKALSGKGVISYRVTKNTTYTERDELKKLYYITEELLNMLSKKPDKAAARRVSARIEDFVVQAEKVMKLLNRGKNPGDVVKEYMS